MELRQLRYFLAVASSQSFTRAAEMVHVSQPSLSVQISALEEELGTRLLDRLGRKVALTQAGELFRDHAGRVLRELEQAAQVVRELEGARRGRLVVGSRHRQFLLNPSTGLSLQTALSGDPSSIPRSAFDRHRDRAAVEPVGCRHMPAPRTGLTIHRRSPFRRTSGPGGACEAPHQENPPAHARSRRPPPGPDARRLLPEKDGGSGMRRSPRPPSGRIGDDLAGGHPPGRCRGAGLTILPEVYVRMRPPSQRFRTLELYDPVPCHQVGLAYRTDRY